MRSSLLNTLAPVALVLSSVAAEWDRLSGPTWIGMDAATAFFPWYTFLGEQLRSGHIPVWNPHQFSGAPFAADPESGWMYLPAMVAFTLLPLEQAIRAHLIFHVLLAAGSTYALARALGAGPVGALVAGTIYAHSGFFEGHNVCCYAYSDVAAWVPLALLGAERAVRAERWRTRALWWGVAGLGVSQILAAWIGQGAYYALLVIVAFIAVRALTTGRRRLTNLVVTTAGVLAFGFALGAAGLLPRFEYNALSNLPGGYPSADVSLRATSWPDWGLIDGWERLLLQPGFEYIGWPAFILALVAPISLFWRRQSSVAFSAVLGLAVLILARREPTPLHAALSLLPGFENIHARSPERALIVFYIAPALLAGLTVSALMSRARMQKASIAAGLLVSVVVALDLHAAWTAQAAQSLAGGGDYQFQRVDLSTYYASTPGARFLMSLDSEQPLRYVGYAGHVFGGPMPYTLRWNDPSITALQVNNRSLITGLEDVQGYNPVHVSRYDEFITALNGHAQNYHHADVFEGGFDSPLLDALNVRFVVLPTTLASDEVAPHFHRSLSSVYQDDTVTIWENPSALPRAWIVHAAEQIPTNTAADAIRDAAFDPRTLAILEAPPPPLAESADPRQEAVTVVSDTADRLVFRASATAPGLLVASEVYYPAWHAYLDGQSVPLYAVDVALRGVALSPGEHLVEMRYESAALLTGLVMSTAAAVLLVGLAILHVATYLRGGSGEVRCKPGAVPQL